MFSWIPFQKCFLSKAGRGSPHQSMKKKIHVRSLWLAVLVWIRCHINRQPLVVRTPPIIPETPEAPPALQALQAMRGTLRRPGPAARAPAPPAPMPRPAMPREAPAKSSSARVLRLTPQRLEKAEAPGARMEEQHKFWWLDRM